MPHVDGARAPDWEEDLEKRYILGCRILDNMDKPNITQVSRELELPYDTLRRRFQGTARPCKEAHEEQMLLTPAQEEVVVDWILYLASTGHPQIMGRAISEAPHTGNEARQSVGARSEARAGIRPVVGRHLAKLQMLIKEHDIAAENIYNMDEK
ncbi:hypothetical protein C8R47DRAFT_1231094 [Mycena vitilis]|nr:hypothetical protein C8R47DRAFT_1231094 [Mycena vitilis]